MSLLYVSTLDAESDSLQLLSVPSLLWQYRVACTPLGRCVLSDDDDTVSLSSYVVLLPVVAAAV